jgi:peptidylprolyl isomerase domain and WD repeat-containing protein 1
MGDIHTCPFPEETPHTVEFFCGHAKRGYYDNVIFHRGVIKRFMMQKGDPLGDVTGGESIWGGEFEDEFERDLQGSNE